MRHLVEELAAALGVLASAVEHDDVLEVGGHPLRRALVDAHGMLVRANKLLDGDWHYTTKGNGAFVTVWAPDGRTALLQGTDAAAFIERAVATNERYTDSDLCREYESVLS